MSTARERVEVEVTGRIDGLKAAVQEAERTVRAGIQGSEPSAAAAGAAVAKAFVAGAQKELAGAAPKLRDEAGRFLPGSGGAGGGEGGTAPAERSGAATAKAYVRALRRDLASEQASIREQALRGLLTPDEAEKRGRDAGARYNRALLAEISRRRSAGALEGQDGERAYLALAGSFRKLGTEGRDAAAGLGAIDDVLAAINPALSVTSVSTAAVAAALVGLATQSTRAAAGLETGLAKVQTTIKLSAQELDGFRDGILGLARAPETTASLDDLARGLQDITGAGIPAAQALGVLEQAARASVGGSTSVATAADVLTTALNVYKGTALDAARANDILFAGVAVGKTTYEALANSLGQVLPIARSSELALDEVVAVLAQLTANGLSTAEAATGIRSALVNIRNPASELARDFPDLAAKFDLARLKGDGFVKFVQDYIRASGGSEKALNALFSDIQGQTAILSLAADGGRSLSTALDEVRNSAGAAERAVGIMSGTTEQAEKLARNRWNAALAEAGRTLLPEYTGAVNAASSALESLVRIFDGDKIGKFNDDLRESIRQLGEARAGLVRRRGNFGAVVTEDVGANSSAARIAASGAQGDLLGLGRRLLTDERLRNGLGAEGQEYARFAFANAFNQANSTMAPNQAREAVKVYGEVVKVLSEAIAKTQQLNQATSGGGGGGGGASTGTREAAKQAKEFARDVEQFAAQVRANLVTLTDTVTGSLTNQIAGLDRAFSELQAKGTVRPEVVASYQQLRAALTEQIAETRRAASAAATYQESLELLNAGAKGSLGEVSTALEQIRAGFDPKTGGVLGDVDASLAQLSTLETRLQAIVASQLVDADTKARAKDLLEQIAALWDEIDGTTARTGRRTADTTKNLGDQLQKLAGGARALLDAAQAAGVLDARLAGALNSAINLAESLPKALSGDVGGILGAAAAVLNIGRSLFGGARTESPEARANREASERNTAALRELAAKLGELALTDTGAARAQAVEVGRRIIARRDRFVGDFEAEEARRRDASPQDFVPGAAPTFNAREALQRVLAELGLGFEDFARQAKLLGIEVRESGEGIDAFLAAAASFSTAFRTLQERWEVLGTTAAERYREFIELLTATPETDTNRAASVARRLREEFDLVTTAGRDAAVAFVREQFRAGTITADIARQLIAAIGAVGQELEQVAGAAEAAVDPLARLATRLSDIAALARVFGTGTAETIQQTLDALGEAFPTVAREIVNLLQGVDLSSQEGFETFRQRVRDFVTSLLVDGLTESEREIIRQLLPILDSAERAFLDTQQAADAGTAAVEGLASSIDAMVGTILSATERLSLSRLGTDATRLGLTPDQAAQYGQEAASNDPILRALLGPGALTFDGRNAGARNGLLDQARERYRALRYDPTATQEQFDALGGLIDWLLSFPTAAAAAASDGNAGALRQVSGPTEVSRAIGGLTESTGNALERIQQSAYLVAQRTAQAAESIDARLAALLSVATRGVLVPPDLTPLATGASSAAAAPQVRVAITIQSLTLAPGMTPADGYAVGQAFGRGIGATLADDVNATLGQTVRLDAYTSGQRGGYT